MRVGPGSSTPGQSRARLQLIKLSLKILASAEHVVFAEGAVARHAVQLIEHRSRAMREGIDDDGSRRLVVGCDDGACMF